MKLSLENLNKVTERCTKKEIDLLIYIGQFQDDYGVIKGIYYKDVLKNIGICKAYFYELLYSLEEKEIIKINFLSECTYWEITLLDNIFVSDDDYKKGYIKLNYEILHSEGFKELTKSEKIIVLNLIKIKDYRNEMIKLTYRKLMEWTGKSLRSVKKFIRILKGIFKIVEKDNVCLISCTENFYTRRQSESGTLKKHLIEYRLRKSKCRADVKDILETITVLKQYKIKSSEMIIDLIDKTINNFGTLIPKYLNKLAQIIKKEPSL